MELLAATRLMLRRSRRSDVRRAVCIVLLAIASFAALEASRSPLARADDSAGFRVIVHPDNPTVSISRGSLADAFLKTSTRWEDGETIRVVDQRVGSSVRRAFSESVLKRSVAAVRSYWQQRIFSGRDVPPPELDSDDAVIDYVLGHRGGVGYVSPAAKLREAKLLVVR